MLEPFLLPAQTQPTGVLSPLPAMAAEPKTGGHARKAEWLSLEQLGLLDTGLGDIILRAIPKYKPL